MVSDVIKGAVVWNVLNTKLPSIRRIPSKKLSIFILILANAVLMKSQRIKQEF